MTPKQTVNYRTGRLQAGTNCGNCTHCGPAENHYDPRPCAILGPGVGKGYTVTHDGVCDRHEPRPNKWPRPWERTP